MEYIDVIDKNYGLTNASNPPVLAARMKEQSEDSLIDFLATLRGSLPRPSKEKREFKFLAGSEMSGLGMYCAAIGCRSKSLS